MSTARILGIDPGTHRVGWGIIEGPARDPVLVQCGCIESAPHTPKDRYLQKIAKDLGDILRSYTPDVVSLETLLFQKNVKTAISVAEARGVIIQTVAAHGIPVAEYAPNTVKSAVGGSGKAGKREVERMVGLLLNIHAEKLLDDTTDALAIALTARAMQGIMKKL